MSSSLDDMKSSAIDAAEIPKESQTTYVPFFRRVLAQKQGRIGLALTAFVVLLAFCGPLLLP